MSLKLHRCTLADLDELLHISRTTFVAAFEKDNDPEDFKTYIDAAFNRDKLKLELEHPDAQFYMVYDASDLVGYFKLNKAAAQTDIHDETSMELERIYVLGTQQGKGIGKWMLHKAIGIARASNLKYLWLGVWEENKAAIKFYQRHGFIQFGTHPYFIGKDKQTDWLMRFDL